MKKILILFYIFLSSCVVEPSPILFDFKFLNNTNEKLILKKHFKKYNSQSEFDTLYPNNILIDYQSSFDCFDPNLKDSLISSFFDTLQITLNGDKIKLNPFERKNWQEKLELKEEILSSKDCVKGKATYILEISAINLK